MVQRSSTHVVGAQTLIDVTMTGLYCDDGVSILPTSLLDSLRHASELTQPAVASSGRRRYHFLLLPRARF